jgi:hypothetical protein
MYVDLQCVIPKIKKERNLAIDCRSCPVPQTSNQTWTKMSLIFDESSHPVSYMNILLNCDYQCW